MIKPSIAMAMAVAATAWISSGPTASGQDETDQRLGTIHFATSCNETAQRRFDRGHAISALVLVSANPRRYSRRSLKADPECAIAYWGIALSLLNNPHTPPPARNLPLGLAAMQKAKAVGAKTHRERDYIDALLVFYTDYDKIAHGARVQAYLKAMEALAQRYPDDDEAQIVYAITLNVAASPNDKTYANQLKGAAILEPIFKRQPRHPGRRALSDPSLRLLRRLRSKGSTLPSAIPRSRRRRRTLSTCPRTSSRAWATGRNRSPPTPPPRGLPRQGKESHDQLHADGLHGLCLSAARAGREARDVVDGDDDDHGVNPRPCAPVPTRLRRVRRATWSSAAIGRARRS